MITSSREEAADFPKKQEPKNKSIPRATSSSSTTPWLKLKDPRIVRVSRAFGGKDRHSKVCTVRGLRDRRVRLSVPTAIQLYDLQERLGLNQPSKVVDWLLNAAKHEIDELPPLQMPPGGHFFGAQNFLHHEMGGAAAAAASQLEDYHPTGLERSNIWNSGTFLRSESKEVASRDHDQNGEKESWMTERNDDDDGGGGDDDDDDNGEVGKHKKGGQIESTSSMSNFFPRPNNNSNQASSLQGLINGGMPPYGSSSYYQFESSNFGQLLLGNHPNVGSSSINDSTSQTDHHHSHHHHHQHQFHNFNVVPFQSTLSLPSGSHVLVCPPPPPTTTQSYVPSSSSPVQPDQQLLDPRQINYFHMLSTINQNKDT